MKFQYIRQGDLPFGRQFEVLPLNNKVFREDIRPLLRPGYARNLEEWQWMHRELTHYARVRNVGEDWTFFRAGRQGDLVPPTTDTRVIEVRSWDSPEAQEWGRQTEAPRKQDWSPRERRRLRREK